MSFYMEVQTRPLSRDRVDDLNAESIRRGGLPVKAYWGLFRRRRFVEELSIWDDVGDGDGGVLSDDADWDASTWAMRPEGIAKLATTLRSLCREIPEGFVFRAAWVGDPVEEEVNLSCDELIDRVERSTLSGRKLYRVGDQSGAARGRT